jgi:hypothetical protein
MTIGARGILLLDYTPTVAELTIGDHRPSSGPLDTAEYDYVEVTASIIGTTWTGGGAFGLYVEARDGGPEDATARRALLQGKGSLPLAGLLFMPLGRRAAQLSAADDSPVIISCLTRWIDIRWTVSTANVTMPTGLRIRARGWNLGAP